jgi:hypothetical protein
MSGKTEKLPLTVGEEDLLSMEKSATPIARAYATLVLVDRYCRGWSYEEFAALQEDGGVKNSRDWANLQTSPAWKHARPDEVEIAIEAEIRAAALAWRIPPPAP